MNEFRADDKGAGVAPSEAHAGWRDHRRCDAFTLVILLAVSVCSHAFPPAIDILVAAGILNILLWTVHLRNKQANRPKP